MNTMGMADAVTKQYMKENTVFADAFIFLLYNGENVILPQTLRELDTAEVVIPFTVDDKGKKQAQAVQKWAFFNKYHYGSFLAGKPLP